MDVKFVDANKLRIENAYVKVLVQDSRVVVDERITVNKTSKNYTVTDKREYAGIGAANYNIDTDPHYYQNGHNGLTIAASISKAYDKVYYDLVGYDKTPTFAANVAEGVEYLIRNDYGRDAAYRFAGIVTKGIREGTYKGVPAGILFKLLTTGEMQPVDPIGDRTNTYYVR